MYSQAVKTGPIIWIIDSQHWPRAYLRAELIERGLEVIAYEYLSESVAVLHRGAAARPEVIVLELHDQYIEPELMDKLAESGVPVIVLKGVFQENEPMVRACRWAVVMRRPFTVGAVADKVQEIAGNSATLLNRKAIKHGSRR